MAFKLLTRIGGDLPFEYIIGTAGEAYTLGEALALDDGRLTKCDPTETPEFISMKTQAAEPVPATKLPVIRVTELQEWETAFSGDGSALLNGSYAVMAADGLRVAAPGEGQDGVFKLSMAGSNAGKVSGYFRRI